MPVPILVMGIGNRLRADDGVGLEVMDRLRATLSQSPDVEFIDGGTLGVALLGYVQGRSALLLLDAVARGDRPGTVHSLEPADLECALRDDLGGAGHRSGVYELLAAGRLSGALPEKLGMIGVEPADSGPGSHLTPTVLRALPEAVDRARTWIEARVQQQI